MPNMEDAPRGAVPAEPASLHDKTQVGAVMGSPVHSVRELVALYLQLELPELAPRSQKHRRRYLSAFSAQFGDNAWDAVYRSDVLAWVRSSTRWKADNTKLSVVVAVNRLFNWAAADRRISSNPVKGLTWNEGPPRRSMTDAEYRTLLRRSPARFRRVLLFMRETGCRPQDVCNLTWPMIDWKAGLALLPEHKTLKKTGKPKLLYLSDLSLRLLRWLAKRPAPAPRAAIAGNMIVPPVAAVTEIAQVFVNAYGQPWQSATLTMRIYRLKHRCGLDRKCVLYGLRHALCNRLQGEGIDIRTVADILGHSSVRTTERHYLHAAETVQSARRALRTVSGK